MRVTSPLISTNLNSMKLLLFFFYTDKRRLFTREIPYTDRSWIINEVGRLSSKISRSPLPGGYGSITRLRTCFQMPDIPGRCSALIIVNLRFILDRNIALCNKASQFSRVYAYVFGFMSPPPPPSFSRSVNKFWQKINKYRA